VTFDAERFACIQLARTPGIGPLTYSKFLATYGSGTEAIRALPERAARAGRREIRLIALKQVEQEIQKTEKFGARILLSSDPDYPALLKAVAPAPPLITVKGHLDLVNRPCIAMVGARNASAAGMKLARTIAYDLGASGNTVVSGLARGIDTAAHHGALETGTIAVIAGGIDNIYPAQNRDLYEQISERGLIVSESMFGHEPKARDFPRRNRIITGLSRAVIVVEAAQRSGSLISARSALDQGRDVMAVPGSPLDPRTKGSNGLLKSGATLVESAEDVLDALADPHDPRQFSLLESESPQDSEQVLENDTEAAEALILKSLSPVPTSITDISAATGLSYSICSSALVELELSGLANSLPGGLVQRVL
tara:strand:- start:353 stop:1453 length:1101 start_codon:yes stop_codon:yes gene_type:complete